MRPNLTRIVLVAALCGALVPSAQAELRPLYRNSRMAVMGGAGVAIAEDEVAVFTNPAAMAGVQAMSLHPLEGEVDAAGNMINDYPAVIEAFSTFTPSSVNALMGRNVYVRGQATPTLLLPNFGLAFIGDTQEALYAKNRALPRVTLGYQNTFGLQAAFGISLNKARGRRKKGEFRLGVGVKALWRRGGYEQLTSTELNALTAQGIAGLQQFAGNYGLGLGVDVGAQWIKKLGRKFTLSAGLSFLDMGDTSFLSPTAQAVRGNLVGGIGGTYETGRMKFILTYDHSHILESIDWRLKNHLGFEFRLPAISIYGGINQVYLTYGVGLDLWLVRLTAMSYAQELGEVAFQEPNRRFMVGAALKLNL